MPAGSPRLYGPERRVNGEHLRHLRVQHNLSQHELADRAAVKDRAKISQLELGRKAARHGTIAAIAKALNVAPDELYADNTKYLAAGEYGHTDERKTHARTPNEKTATATTNTAEKIRTSLRSVLPPGTVVTVHLPNGDKP